MNLGHGDREIEEARHVERSSAEEVVQVLGPGVLEDEDRPVVALLEAERARHAGEAEAPEDLPLVAQQLVAARPAAVGTHALQDDGFPVRAALSPEHLESLAGGDVRSPHEHGL